MISSCRQRVAAWAVGMWMLTAATAHAAVCGPGFINPITDIAWPCVLPIRIGGVAAFHADAEPEDTGVDAPDTPPRPQTSVPPDPEGLGSSICTCQQGASFRVGLSVSFWEPARLIDTVATPWCLMPTGTQLSNPSPGSRDGGYGHAGGEGPPKLFAQMHWYQFPAWAVLGLFTDLPCLTDTEFDLAMMTEVVPTWNDDVLALLLNPEALLFANPVAQLACTADAAAVLSTGLPTDELFWCMGGWNGAYPLAGSVQGSDMVEMHAALAARGIYFMARTGLMMDPGVDQCGSVVTPIWNKRNYRLQQIRPVRENACHAIGDPGLLWTAGRNPPTAGDNFLWMLFRKAKCCVGWGW